MNKLQYEKILKIAVSKCKPSGRWQWGGCLTPSEIIALNKSGAFFEQRYFEWAKDDFHKGDSRPHTMYFYPKKELKAMLEKSYEIRKGHKHSEN
jgi:hypothetical protein